MKLVCTDLDRTLLPNGEHKESIHARPILWHLLRTHGTALGYVSGRDLERVLDAVVEYDLPLPDFIGADVGTSIYIRHENAWIRSAEWESLVARDWNGGDSDDIHELLTDTDYLQDQEDDRQSTFKRSYYFPESANEDQLRDDVESCLNANGVDASLVFSHDPEKSVGLLDVVPRSATKREAVTYLRTQARIPAGEVMFAGDSGNDVTAICADHAGVLVANADQATVASVHEEISASGRSGNTYFATGGMAVAGLDNLNGHYAAGIVEGLMHFRPAWRGHLQDAGWVEQALNSLTVSGELLHRRSA